MPPLSLQAHIANLPASPVAITVDPRGFKAALQSFIQFLIAHRIQATLWLKLPKDDAWWQDIWQYGQLAAGCTIYSLGEQTGKPPSTLAASLRPIAIDQTAELKREYLCMAVCDQFVGSLLAARVASVSASNKRTLQLYGSTSLSVAAALSNGVKAVIESSLPDKVQDAGNLDLSDDKAIPAAAALSQWGRMFPKTLWAQDFLPLSEAFLAWQMQSQEDLRLQINEHRTNHKATEDKPATQTIDANFLRQAKEELQSPLTTIKTALTLLESPTLKLIQRQRYMEMITTQCDRQKNLISSIVELLQIQTTQSKQPQPIELSELLPGIVSTYEPIASERGIVLAYTVPEQIKTVLGLEAELKQVVIHLIKNAIHRTAHRKAQGGRVWVSAALEGDRFVALTVRDSGSPIPPGEIDQLFGAFYSSAESRSATLELALVKPLVQKMQGKVIVESLPDQNTCFKVLLPVQSFGQSSGTAQATDSQAIDSYAAPGTSQLPHVDRVSKGRLEENTDKDRTVRHLPTGRQSPLYVS
ncbi:MAG: ATP-binding protein [Cyanobacteria bacterium P01_D01_bin.1]